MSSGENLRKYNILLQSMMLDIENPHMVQNSFLNENTVLHPKPNTNQNCVVQGLPLQNAINESNHNYLQLMSSSPGDSNCMPADDHFMFDDSQFMH
jgi:hypothetical protein